MRHTFPFAALLLWSLTAAAADIDPIKAAQAYRADKQAVEPASDTTVVCEAEEFRVASPGWRAKAWGDNYFAATLANCFLSRKAYLGAPEQCDRTTATITAKVPKAGRYLALVRYEAVYRFETQFRLKVGQGGQAKLDRLYGARDNLKVWAFGQKLKKELAWDWGAGESVVWEGHDAFVDLAAGEATLTLTAEKQPEPAARRNVDLVMLTSDLDGVKSRIDKESYLPLDGLLTQAGDVHLRLHNKGTQPLTLTVPPATEHSPYWVHQRTWKPKMVTAAAGAVSEWTEVGSLLDSLNDGQWKLSAKSAGPVSYDLEFAVRTAAGKIEPIRTFAGLTGDADLAYDADTRYTRRIRLSEEVLYDLVASLKKVPVVGPPPKRTLIYALGPDPRPGNAKYTAALEEFRKLSGLTALESDLDHAVGEGGLRRGNIDVRHLPTNMLEDYCKKLKAEGKADNVAVVSLGDEIGLEGAPAGDHAGFRAWLKGQGLKPSDVDPAAGDSWDKVKYSPDAKPANGPSPLYYYSKVYGYRYGIRQLKERTDILHRNLPNAAIGANFSPHHKHLYLGDTAQWISLFREGALTMPWGEDYIWQVPVATQQINFLMLDMFRCGVRNRPDAKIHYYVMPHTPGNTTPSWRRQFYGDLAHGAKVLNLFEYRPVQLAYTENHCSDPAMYAEVRRSLHELARFEDIIQDGHVRAGVAALWFSEAADVWDDNRAPFDAAKRTLYAAIRHQQLPLDCVTEGDDLSGYKVLYLTDTHVSRAASKAIADWVNKGGQLFATAWAGTYDEFNQPNKVLWELLGVAPLALTEATGEVIRREKEDLPFVKSIDVASVKVGEKQTPLTVYGLRARVVMKGAQVLTKFADGSAAAVTRRKVGQGQAWQAQFLPGLSYFQPALPKRPMDRRGADDALCHLIPTAFDPVAAAIIAAPAEGVQRPVVCSEPLVETTVIEAKGGTVVPLVNWSKGPVRGLAVTVGIDVPANKVELASGKPVKASGERGKRVYTLDLDVADALILH
jgi:hypothetical protein